MPKKKSYKININYNEKLDTISSIFGLSAEKMENLMKRFRENIRDIAEAKPKFQLAEVVEAAMKAAQDDAEFAYIFFRTGKEQEQQKIKQAAMVAEKFIIPRMFGKKDVKRIIN